MPQIIPLSGAQAAQFLPVLYASLDPAHMPTPDDMDADPLSPSTTKTLGVIRWTTCTLHNLKADFPREHCANFWPRFWAWSEFSLTYAASSEVGDRCYDFLAFMGRLYAADDAARLMYATPGVRRLVTRAWKVILEHRTGDCFDAAFIGVAGFISGGNIQNGIVLCDGEQLDEHLQEFIDGAGGTMADLTQLLIKHLAHFLPLKQVLPPKTMSLTAMSFLYTTLGFLETPGLSFRILDPALLEHGIIPMLIAILDVAVQYEECPILLYVKSLTVLYAILAVAEHRWLRQALDCGVIRVLLDCSVHPSRLDLAMVERFLTVVAMSLVYHPIVLQIESCISDVKDMLKKTNFSCVCCISKMGKCIRPR
ncbi:hypothetical protein C8J57DRAFT_630959 [Mycena rebaudengoi]|nr:hypothetical protein C8J57DRAFT_630959 [Mycena rebaudengoi]